MKCPKCSNVTLLISEKQNVEIDYCPECRGIWLDRGELEKIIERSYVQNRDDRSDDRSYDRSERFEHDDDHNNRDYDDDRHRAYGDKRQYKKKSFLGDLFDF